MNNIIRRVKTLSSLNGEYYKNNEYGIYTYCNGYKTKLITICRPSHPGGGTEEGSKSVLNISTEGKTSINISYVHLSSMSSVVSTVYVSENEDLIDYFILRTNYHCNEGGDEGNGVGEEGTIYVVGIVSRYSYEGVGGRDGEEGEKGRNWRGCKCRVYRVEEGEGQVMVWGRKLGFTATSVDGGLKVGEREGFVKGEDKNDMVRIAVGSGRGVEVYTIPTYPSLPSLPPPPPQLSSYKRTRSPSYP